MTLRYGFTITIISVVYYQIIQILYKLFSWALRSKILLTLDNVTVTGISFSKFGKIQKAFGFPKKNFGTLFVFLMQMLYFLVFVMISMITVRVHHVVQAIQ